MYGIHALPHSKAVVIEVNVLCPYCVIDVRGGMGSSNVLREEAIRRGGSRDARVAGVLLRRRMRAVPTPAAVVVVQVPVLVARTTADGDQAGARAGRRVPVATAQRLLPGDLLRGADLPVDDRRRGDRRRRAVPDGRADRDGRGAAADQRGVVRAVDARRPPAAVDRLVAGHGVLGRSGGVHLSARRGHPRRPRAAAVAAGAPGRRRRVRLQRLGRRARVPVDVDRRAAARHRPIHGRRAARVVRVRPDVCRAQGVPVRGHAERWRRRRRLLDGRRVRGVRRCLAGHSRVRVRLSARNAGQTDQRDRGVFRRPAAAGHGLCRERTRSA